jgi:hypothetical protein
VLSGRTIRVSSHPRHRLSFRRKPFGRRGISSACKLRDCFCQQFGQQFCQQIGLPPPRERGDDLFVLSGRTIRVPSHPRHRLSFRRKPFGRRGISSACKLRDCFCQQFCQQNWAPAGAPPPLLVIPTEPFGRRGISSACKLRGGFCQQFCQQIRLPPAHPRLCLSFRQSPSGDEESHPFVI